MPKPFSPAPAALRDLVSITDFAAEYGISVKTVRRRIADGTLTAYRVGSRIVRVDRREAGRLVRQIGGGAA